jgi:hypothetical protein
MSAGSQPEKLLQFLLKNNLIWKIKLILQKLCAG